MKKDILFVRQRKGKTAFKETIEQGRIHNFGFVCKVKSFLRHMIIFRFITLLKFTTLKQFFNSASLEISIKSSTLNCLKKLFKIRFDYIPINFVSL